MLLQLNGALAFKIIQNCGRRKLILDKTLNTEFTFQEYKSVWTHYFSPTLNQPRNRPPKKTNSLQKQNQEKTPNITQKDVNGRQNKKGKSDKKKEAIYFEQKGL
ncbi:unnamed protein product [Rhizophagus irregularis]|uniref:Uncharacterized protein n=1 Tax=Rhizophagus irregularis TaxID=588596 RepID=A0A2N1MD39_9GLOM|nr:hypothetical protein RhiirC2_794756 [Rhizophagus irregularis]CAB4375158.1 unnamed protein product [Rhizophagus irregularis]